MDRLIGVHDSCINSGEKDTGVTFQTPLWCSMHVLTFYAETYVKKSVLSYFFLILILSFQSLARLMLSGGLREWLGEEQKSRNILNFALRVENFTINETAGGTGLANRPWHVQTSLSNLLAQNSLYQEACGPLFSDPGQLYASLLFYSAGRQSGFHACENRGGQMAAIF